MLCSTCPVICNVQVGMLSFSTSVHLTCEAEKKHGGLHICLLLVTSYPASCAVLSDVHFPQNSELYSQCYKFNKWMYLYVDWYKDNVCKYSRTHLKGRALLHLPLTLQAAMLIWHRSINREGIHSWEDDPEFTTGNFKLRRCLLMLLLDSDSELQVYNQMQQVPLHHSQQVVEQYCGNQRKTYSRRSLKEV